MIVSEQKFHKNWGPKKESNLFNYFKNGQTFGLMEPAIKLSMSPTCADINTYIFDFKRNHRLVKVLSLQVVAKFTYGPSIIISFDLFP